MKFSGAGKRPKHRAAAFGRISFLATSFAILLAFIVFGSQDASNAVLNPNSGDFQITMKADASGCIPTQAGTPAVDGGFMVSGSFNMQYAWTASGDAPTSFTNLTNSSLAGGTATTSSTRMIPAPATCTFAANQIVKLTLHPIDSTSRMFGFHGWLEKSKEINTAIGVYSDLLVASAAKTYNANLVEMINFGDSSMNLQSLRYAFASTTSSFSISAQLPPTVTQLDFVFRDSLYNEQGVTSWDMSHVLETYGMFGGNYEFNQNIGNWDVSSVTDMSYMFEYRYVGTVRALFNQDISRWNVSKVTSMKGMFRTVATGGRAFNQPIGDWTTSALVDLGSDNSTGMFYGASDFNQPLNHWDVSKVTKFSGVFYKATSFNQPLNSWNTAAGQTFSYMFAGATAFNQDLSSWNMSSAASFAYMFNGASNFNNGESYAAGTPGSVPLNWNTSNVMNIDSMFMGAAKFNQSLDGWNLKNLAFSQGGNTTEMYNVFNGAAGFNNGDAQGVSGQMNWILANYKSNRNMLGMFQNASSFNQDTSSWQLWGQKNVHSIFNGATRFDQPIGHFQLATINTGSSAGSGITLDGMSQSNYEKTIVEWAMRPGPNSGFVTYVSLASRLKEFSTCIGNAAFIQLKTANINKVGFSSVITGTNPGGCVDHTVSWSESNPYSIPRAVSGQAGTYEITPNTQASSLNSGTVKYMIYTRQSTADCNVNPDTGVVTYTSIGASCTVRAYVTSPDSQALYFSENKVFTTVAPATYTVTYSYNLGNSSGTLPTSTVWSTGDPAITLPTPERTNFTFDAWYSASNFASTPLGATFTPTANTSLYARFVSVITFEPQNGTSATVVRVEAGNSVLAPGITLVSRAGYSLGDWYSDTTYSTKVATKGAGFTATGNATLYAKWTANTLNVTYNQNGGSGASGSSTTKTGETLSEPTSPTRTGYTFNGWFSDSGLTSSIASWPHTHGATANFSIYAGWTANTLTITYSTNGGSSISSGSTVTGATISSAPTSPTRTGYSFVGWYSDSGLSSAVSWPYTHGKTANFTIYAKWTANTLVLTYVSNGGSAVTNGSTVTAGTISSAPTAPTRTGYNFLGWYTDAVFTTAVNWPFTHGETSDFSLYAKWVSRTQSPLSWNLISTSVPYQGSLSLGVTGGSGTGSVTYSRSGNSTCTISGSTLTPGQGGSVCVITATKAADADFDAASTVQQTITITKINQASFSWNLSSTSVAYLGSLTLATSGGSGTGTVVYSASGDSTCSIVGTTLIPSDAGSTCEITATKVSDTNYNSADTATQTITVTKISQATLSFSNSNALVFGQTMDLLATGGSGGGSITYAVSNAGTTGCSLSANQLSVTGAGTCAVTAVRASSTNYNASSTASLSITVSKASQTVSFSSTIPAEPIAGDTYAVSATASSGLTPTIAIASGPCSISNNVVTLTSAGNCVISADSSSTNQYLAATTATQTVAIGQRNQTLTFSSTVRAMTVKTYGDPVFFADATTSEPTLTPVYSRGSATTNTACSVSSIGLVVILAVGNCEIEVNQAGDSAVAAASAIKKTFEVLPDRANAPFITSVSAGHESITAAFTAPNYVGGSAISGYQIAAVSGSTTITNSACTLAGSGNTETCTITGLTNGTSYRIKVAAITAAGVGLYSDLSAARVPATNPAAVSAFTAVPDNTSIVLTWQDPVSLGGGTFDSYRVFYKLSSSANYPNTYITIQSQSPTNYTITGLVNGESYDVRIVTVTTTNTAALVSNTAEVKETPRTVPEAPATVEVLEVGGQLVITWSTPQSDGGNAITEYRVTINGTTCTLANALDNLCTIAVPTNGGTYPIEVLARNDAGYGSAATATFTKAGVSSSGGSGGGSGGGSESSSNGQSAIQVLALSVKSLPNVGGQVVSITGKNLGAVTTILIDGIKAKIISVTDGLIKFTAPSNTDGPATLTLKSPTASAEVVDAFTYSMGIAKVKVAWVLGFVQANTTIKAADKAKLRNALQKNTGTVAVTCVGYQSYSYNTAKDAQTAMGRAKQACNYLKSVNPKLTVKSVIARTTLAGTPSRKLAVQFKTSK